MNDALATTEKIIKADTRGRLRLTAERREFLLEEFERSAMTGRKFAEWAGIKYSTFGNWWRARKKARRAALPAPTGTTPRWLEAVVANPQLEAGNPAQPRPLIVHGRGGVRLELSDAGQIKLAAQLPKLPRLRFPRSTTLGQNGASRDAYAPLFNGGLGVVA